MNYRHHVVDNNNISKDKRARFAANAPGTPAIPVRIPNTRFAARGKRFVAFNSINTSNRTQLAISSAFYVVSVTHGVQELLQNSFTVKVLLQKLGISKRCKCL